MRPEDSHRTDWAVLWEATGIDDYGNPTISSTPVDVAVRWETTKRRGGDPNSDAAATDIKAVVGRTVPLGSAMWIGRIADLPGTAELPESDVMRVVDYTEVPDVKGRYLRRQVTLVKAGDALPAFT